MTAFTSSDEQLVEAAKAGDGAAMDALLRRHFDRIHAVCRRIAGTTRDADDAAQEAAIRIVRNLASFDGRSSFATWAYRIATNTSLDELRKRSRRPQLHLVDEPGTEVADEYAGLEVELIADRMSIDAALAGLPVEFQIPVVLRDVAGLDYAEIADHLGVPVGTVKSRIARGRRQLVGQLGNHNEVDERPTDDPQDPTT